MTDEELNELRKQIREERLRRRGSVQVCWNCSARFYARKGAKYCSNRCTIAGYRKKLRSRSDLTFDTARGTASLSPLSYSRGKMAMAGYLARVVQALDLPRPEMVEPFKGGSGPGLGLLRDGLVDSLVICEADVAVYSFWASVVHECDRLCALVEEVPLTLEERIRQQDVYEAGDEQDGVSLGFSVLYLNRVPELDTQDGGTSTGKTRSAQLAADGKFDRDDLVKRIATIGSLRDRIEVSNVSGLQALKDRRTDGGVFFFIDPPRTAPDDLLYRGGRFVSEDHIELGNILAGMHDGNWIMTLPLSEEVEILYSSFPQFRYQIDAEDEINDGFGGYIVSSKTVSAVMRKLSEQTPASPGR